MIWNRKKVYTVQAPKNSMWLDDEYMLFRPTEEIESWLDQHKIKWDIKIIAREQTVIIWNTEENNSNIYFLFTKEKDAMLFTLRWT